MKAQVDLTVVLFFFQFKKRTSTFSLNFHRRCLSGLTKEVTIPSDIFLVSRKFTGYRVRI
jgi:hypothetical protein